MRKHNTNEREPLTESLGTPSCARLADGQISGGGGVEFPEIWNTLSSEVIYDDNYGASEDIDDANPKQSMVAAS